MDSACSFYRCAAFTHISKLQVIRSIYSCIATNEIWLLVSTKLTRTWMFLIFPKTSAHRHLAGAWERLSWQLLPTKDRVQPPQHLDRNWLKPADVARLRVSSAKSPEETVFGTSRLQYLRFPRLLPVLGLVTGIIKRRDSALFRPHHKPQIAQAVNQSDRTNQYSFTPKGHIAICSRNHRCDHAETGNLLS